MLRRSTGSYYEHFQNMYPGKNPTFFIFEIKKIKFSGYAKLRVYPENFSTILKGPNFKLFKNEKILNFPRGNLLKVSEYIPRAPTDVLNIT